MANLIKPLEARPASRPEAAPFEDLTRRAERCLESARGEALALRAAARDELETQRARHLDDWRREADAEFQARVAAEVERRLAELTPVLRQASQQWTIAEKQVEADRETVCLQLAAAIAERVIRRELLHGLDIPLNLIREALELAGGSHRVRLCLHPAQEPALRPHVQKLLAGQSGRSVEIVPDPTVTVGGCRVETAHGVIDQQVEAQLRRILEELVP